MDIHVSKTPYIPVDGYPAPKKTFLNRAEQQYYKYVMNIEGYSGWADRLKDELFGGGTMIMQQTQCREWYGMALEPWVHYVPMDQYFRDIDTVMEYVTTHDKEMEQLVSNMNKYAETLITDEGMHEYVHAMLITYAELMTFKVENSDGFETAEGYLYRHDTWGGASWTWRIQLLYHEVSNWITQRMLEYHNYWHGS